MSDNFTKIKISQIISGNVITVAPDTLVTDALICMASNKISCLVIAEEDRPVGIFTERDVVRVANASASFDQQTINSVMSSPVITIPGQLTVIEAYHLMLTKKIRHHVVVDRKDRILGVMSQSDLISLLGLEYFVEMRKVDQVMTVSVMTVDRGLSVADALNFMAGPGISCVVVTDGEIPVGIITERDAVRFLAEQMDLRNVTVEEVMSRPIVSVQVGTTVHGVAQLMQESKIRRILVVNPDGQVKGIITQSDIIRGLEGQYVESLKEIIREKESVFQETAKQLLDKTMYLDNILSSSIDSAIIATDGDLQIRYFNKMAETVLGCSAGYAVGRSALELNMSARSPSFSFQKAREAVRRQGKFLFSEEMKRDGVSHHYDCSISGILDKQGNLVGFVLILQDVTERRKYESTIRHMAYHDSLTGLPNRVLLMDRLGLAIATADRNGTRGALMLLDLDRFKDVNDTLGHSTGDQLLKVAADRLKLILRKSDTVCRMGGDEFVLLLPNITSGESAELTAGKVLKALRKPVPTDSRTLKITASIGIALFPDDGNDTETLMRKADITLYRVKDKGRNGFLRYEEK